jgi:hypothetical protein
VILKQLILIVRSQVGVSARLSIPVKATFFFYYDNKAISLDRADIPFAKPSKMSSDRRAKLDLAVNAGVSFDPNRQLSELLNSKAWAPSESIDAQDGAFAD